MVDEQLSVRDALLSFAAGEPLRAALFLTYSFDGRWFEEAIVPELCERPIETMLVVRDRNAIANEAPSVRYRKVNACSSSVFHPKLALLVTRDRARAVIGSANLTRGGFERSRELGRVFDLGPQKAKDHGIFASLLAYFHDGLASELRGDAARDLEEVARALHEVVTRHEAPAAAAHVLLHGYSKPIWTQVLESLPHRVLRRVVIMSPFFEPDLQRQHPEDPAFGPRDHSVFASLLERDFEFEPPKGEPPVRVYFRHGGGRTELPVRKLGEYGDKLVYFAEDTATLHAKLLLLEGAEGEGREPFLVALHGSPNFTAAALTRQPPHGNSELAVLTTLPAKRKGFERAVRVLGLDRGFHRVEDPSSLQTEATTEPPALISRGVADLTYRVDEGVVVLILVQAAPAGARVRVRLPQDGSWNVVGESNASGLSEVFVAVPGVAGIDEDTKLLEIRCMAVRVEIVGVNDEVLASDTVPINVNVPEEFCGLTMVGPVALTLDERIARAGIGAPLTYRQQQKWIEGRKERGTPDTDIVVLAHQADLDRFHRNVHRGLRGLSLRARAMPGSEHSARRTLDELTRWAKEAVTNEADAMSRECRLFLVERILREMLNVLEGISPPLRGRLPALAVDLGVADRLGVILAWLEQIDEQVLTAYAAQVRAHAQQVSKTLANGAGR